MRSAWLRGLNIAALLPLLSAVSAVEARAADCTPIKGLSPCVDADNLWPHPGGGPYFALGSTGTTPRGSLSFGLVGTFLSEPVGVRVASADPAGSTVFLVDKAVNATLLVALGVTSRLELTLAAPATLYQSGAGLTPVSATAPPLVAAAVRDVRFGLAYAVLQRPRAGHEDPRPAHGPALTVRCDFVVPSGSDGAFAGGPTAVVAPAVAFSYRIGRVDVSAEVVARLRGEATFANAVVGPQVGGALGSSVDILKDRWLNVGAEAFALYTTSKQLEDQRDGSAPAPLVPAEWIGHVSTAHFLGGDVVVGVGGGSTIPFSTHAAVTSPQYRLDLALRYAPTGRDEPKVEPAPPEPPSISPPSAVRDL